MSREDYSLYYGRTRIDYSVVRRERTTLEIAVEPDTRVVVAAPDASSAEEIQAKIRKRAAWILRQQRYFQQFLPRTPERRFVSGETHLYLGRQYRLKILPAEQEKVRLKRGFLSVFTRCPDSADRARLLVAAWYRERALARIPERLESCLQKFSPSDRMRPNRLILRTTKTRWGSMSPAGNLLINPKLLQAPVDAIDYVITHELCHLREPHHGPAFHELLSRVLPDWEKRKLRLERILA